MAKIQEATGKRDTMTGKRCLDLVTIKDVQMEYVRRLARKKIIKKVKSLRETMVAYYTFEE